jgi:hypothetical protein
MGVVMDRGRRMASYLRAFTGSPLWKFHYQDPVLGRGFRTPEGYRLSYLSCKHTGDAVAAARAMKDNVEVSGVLYSHYYTEPDDAVVILPLRHYALLVKERLDRP